MSKQLTLGELIILLSTCNQCTPVRFDFGVSAIVPDEIDSYRGNYRDLAIGYSEDASDITVAEFSQKLIDVNGTSLTGYKGGSFLMDSNTPVWVANYGCSSNTIIVDVLDYNYIAYLKTEVVL